MAALRKGGRGGDPYVGYYSGRSEGVIGESDNDDRLTRKELVLDLYSTWSRSRSLTRNCDPRNCPTHATQLLPTSIRDRYRLALGVVVNGKSLIFPWSNRKGESGFRIPKGTRSG
jgi:hypothetical protein